MKIKSFTSVIAQPAVLVKSLKTMSSPAKILPGVIGLFLLPILSLLVPQEAKAGCGWLDPTCHSGPNDCLFGSCGGDSSGDSIPQTCNVTGCSRPKKSTTCYTVDSRKGWQKFTFPKTYTRIASISGAWSVDSINYSNVGPEGYSGNDAQRLEPYSQYKFNQSYPFGALLVADVSGNARSVGASPQDLDNPRREIYMRINDNAFSDNAGSLGVCFGE